MGEHLESSLHGDDEGLSMVMNEGARLVNLAHRSLGSMAEAEDAVLETYTRWYCLSTDEQERIEELSRLLHVATRTDVDTHELTERYVGVWNEPDPVRRRRTIEELWTAQGVHVLQATAAIDEAAVSLGFGPFTHEARGHTALERRVRRSHDEFVASGNFTFRSRGNASRVGHVVTFTWEMVTAEGDEVAAAGLEVLMLDQDGRIAADYQFVER